ncbi:hypothetical protein DVH24_006476 [Malus domestica]|uniref:GED domain-containing protein n=1 Tax=Malus domestica TaxID=3750 RepID=A0A498KAH5_MALDO|nr:hypothetical protein DVH24_006476 [Malus domestica]
MSTVAIEGSASFTSTRYLEIYSTLHCLFLNNHSFFLTLIPSSDMEGNRKQTKLGSKTTTSSSSSTTTTFKDEGSSAALVVGAEHAVPLSVVEDAPIVSSYNDKIRPLLDAVDKLRNLMKMPKSLSSDAEAITAFMQIIGVSKESLRKILVRGEFDEYPGDKRMHCTARLVEMLNQYSDELLKCNESDPTVNFLTEEIRILEEAKGITLPNFLPRNAFLSILQGKVRGISDIPIRFVEQVWSYIEDVVLAVLMHNTQDYYHLHLATRRAGHNLIAKMKEKSIHWILEIVEMEKHTDYTCNPEYAAECSRLMTKQNAFLDGLNDEKRPSKIVIEGIGEVEVEGLRKYKRVDLSQAYDLKMRMTAYWKVVLKRLVDSMALHLQLNVANLVNKDMEMEIVGELVGPNHGCGIEKMLEESPSTAVKREKLNKSIKKLKDSKEVVGKIMDGVITYAVSISKNFQDIVKKIDDKLNSYLSELNKMPKCLSSVGEATTVLMHIIGLSKESHRKILNPDEKHMHCTARLVEILNQYSDELHKCATKVTRKLIS